MNVKIVMKMKAPSLRGPFDDEDGSDGEVVTELALTH